MVKHYNNVKSNIINNFLIRNYLWTCVSCKKTIFDDMLNRCPFPFEYNYEDDLLKLNLGDNININVNFTWETRSDNLNHLINIY